MLVTTLCNESDSDVMYVEVNVDGCEKSNDEIFMDDDDLVQFEHMVLDNCKDHRGYSVYDCYRRNLPGRTFSLYTLNKTKEDGSNLVVFLRFELNKMATIKPERRLIVIRKQYDQQICSDTHFTAMDQAYDEIDYLLRVQGGNR